MLLDLLQKLSAIDGTNTFLIREKTATTGDDFKEDSLFSFVFALFVCRLNSSNKATRRIILHDHHSMRIKYNFLIPTLAA